MEDFLPKFLFACYVGGYVAWMLNYLNTNKDEKDTFTTGSGRDD